MSSTRQQVNVPKPTKEQWAAARRAQAIVREFIPEGVSLVDELIAERRAAAERE